MSYQKQTFIDQVKDSSGNITTQGTVLKASHLQHIENGIAANEVEISKKQEALSSGKNIKTINGQSLLGSGNIDISGGSSTATTAKPIPKFDLAASYDLVVGDTFQLFYTNVVRSFSPLDEGINILCSKGNMYPRYYEWKPAADEVGSYPLTFQLRDLNGKIINTETTVLNVHAQLTNETTPKNLSVLCFGSSTTATGLWPCEGLRRIYGDPNSGASGPKALGLTNTVTSYGKKTVNDNTFTAKHEGYGGWSWHSFLSAGTDSSNANGIYATLPNDHGYDLNAVQKTMWVDNNNLQWELEDFPASNQIKFNRGPGNDQKQKDMNLPTTLTCERLSLTISNATYTWEKGNPFWDDETNSVNFVSHARECGAEPADVVACMLSWNDGGGADDGTFNYFEIIDYALRRAKRLLRKIHSDLPNAKILVFGLIPPSSTGGCGYNYGAVGSLADMWGAKFYAMDYSNALEEICLSREFKDFCYYVDIGPQFDTVYNMPYIMKAVNTRNSINTELLGVNGVHPDTMGYYQIGDAYYRALSKVVPMIVNPPATEQPEQIELNIPNSIKPFANCTWLEARSVLAAGSLNASGKWEYNGQVWFNIGDEKTFTLSDGTILTAQIADFDHDVDKYGNKIPATIIIKELLPEVHCMNPIDKEGLETNYGGWVDSTLYKYLHTEVFEKLPEDLRVLITPVMKSSTAGSKDTTIQTAEDILFIPSAAEVGGQSVVPYIDEGTLYPIFSAETAATRVKNVAGTSTPSLWWTRSPNPGTTTAFLRVKTTGSVSNENASTELGIAFGFCLGGHTL